MPKRSTARAGFASPQLRRRVVARPPNHNLRHIPHNSPEWTADSTTCLSLGLDPRDPDVGSYACGGCKEYWEKELRSDINNSSEKARSCRTSCDRVFACDDSAKPYRVRVRDELKEMFAKQEGSSEPPDSMEADHVVTPLVPRSGARPPMTSSSASKMKDNRGMPRLFDERGGLTDGLIDMILPRLEDRKYLEDHELNLLIVLLKIYCSATAQSLPEQTVCKVIEDMQISCMNLQDRKELTPSQERVLGQLAVIGFRNSKNNYLSVANFPRNRQLQIAKLPGEYKQGDEGKNKRLYKRRIDTGRRWLEHLPGTFNDTVISRLFLEIDKVVATKTIKEYYSLNMRLQAENSACLKIYASLNDKVYERFERMLFYLLNIRVLAPIKEVRKLKQDMLRQDYTTLTRKVVDMTRVNKKSGVTRRIKVGVMLLRPHESILNIMASYLSNDLFVPSEKRFRKPSNIPANVKDVVLIKYAADKGGGAWKFTLNPVNVESPQSLRHVRPICEYAADDSRDNMRAAVFYEGSPYRADMEEVLHRRAVVLHVQVGDRSEVGLVVNTSRHHHRKRPISLPNTCHVRLYQNCVGTNQENTFDGRVARVDFSVLRCILLMYNTVAEKFDKIGFVDARDNIIGTLTLKNPIDFCYKDGGDPPQFNIHRYLLAGIFTGDLDFLANFLGHQGASARWLCMFCLARQSELHRAFRLAGDPQRFPKRQGVTSMKELYKIYKRQYLDLDPKLKTKAKKEQVTRELSFSVVGFPLADVPVDVIAPATMHIILGLTKKIYDYLLALFSRLEEMEEEKTQGHVPYQFRDGIKEAKENARKYIDHLQNEFKDHVETVEKKELRLKSL